MVDDVKILDYVWVFISDKFNVLGSEFVWIVRFVYGCIMSNNEGFE